MSRYRWCRCLQDEGQQNGGGEEQSGSNGGVRMKGGVRREHPAALKLRAVGEQVMLGGGRRLRGACRPGAHTALTPAVGACRRRR